MLKIPIEKDGYVKASQLVEILTPVVEGLAQSINANFEELESENRELRHRVEFLERQSRAPFARVNPPKIAYK